MEKLSFVSFFFFYKEEGNFHSYLVLHSFGYPELPAIQLKPKQSFRFLFYWLNHEIRTFNFVWNVLESVLFIQHVEYLFGIPLITYCD